MKSDSFMTTLIRLIALRASNNFQMYLKAHGLTTLKTNLPFKENPFTAFVLTFFPQGKSICGKKQILYLPLNIPDKCRWC